MHTTSLTPGLLALSLEQPCRLQVASRTTALPSRRPAGGSTLGRTDRMWAGPPGGRSRSSLPRLKAVGLGCDLLLLLLLLLVVVLVDGALERSTYTWEKDVPHYRPGKQFKMISEKSIGIGKMELVFTPPDDVIKRHHRKTASNVEFQQSGFSGG